LVEVDDRLDGDLDVGAAAPVADLVGGQDPVAGLFDVPTQVVTGLGQVGSEDGVCGQVGVEDDLRDRPAGPRSRLGVVEPERELVAGEVTERGRTTPVDRVC
jgi:hypothetical protein